MAQNIIWMDGWVCGTAEHEEHRQMKSTNLKCVRKLFQSKLKIVFLTVWWEREESMGVAKRSANVLPLL